MTFERKPVVATKAIPRTAVPRASSQLDAIKPGEGFLPLKTFLNRTGQGNHSWMTAKRKARALGITLACQHGSRVFVCADDWILLLKSNPAAVADPKPQFEADAVTDEELADVSLIPATK